MPNTDIQNWTDLKGSYTKLNSLAEIQKTITSIHGDFPTKGTPELRSWIRLLRFLHPLIDQFLTNLEYFQPVSDDMGCLTITYLPDTPTLDLEDWGANWLQQPTKAAPYALRQITHYKLNSRSANLIDNSYADLNAKMASNISQEYEAGTEKRAPRNIAHSYNLQGDVSWWQDHLVGGVKWKDRAVIYLRSYLLDLIRLINHQFTVNTSIKVTNDVYTIIVEGHTIQIDKKGNKVNSIPTAINNTVLKAQDSNGNIT